MAVSKKEKKKQTTGLTVKREIENLNNLMQYLFYDFNLHTDKSEHYSPSISFLHNAQFVISTSKGPFTPGENGKL